MRKLKNILLSSRISRPLILVAFILAIVAWGVNAIESRMGWNNHYDPYKPHNAMSMRGLENGSSGVWSGKVKDISYKQRGGEMVILVTLETVYFEGNRLAGGKYVQLYVPQSDVRMGQILTIKGELKYFERARNEGEFDSYKYYRNIGVMFMVNNAAIIEQSEEYSIFRHKMWKIKYLCEKRLREIYDEDDAAILKAMLLGIKGDIPQEIKEAFQKSGVAHILAISGLHISFLCLTLYKVICMWRKDAACVLSLAFLGTYVVMVGEPVSALRAGIMFVCMIGAKLVKRSYDMINSLAIAFITVEISNLNYIFDIAFQLSLVAVLAVGFYARILLEEVRDETEKRERKCSKISFWRAKSKWITNKIISPVIVTTTVFIVTLPVLLYCYYEVAFYSIILNLIILPLMPMLLVSAILSLILTSPVNCASAFCAGIAKTILYLYKYLCSYLEKTGLGRRNIGRPEVWKILLYFCILTVVFLYHYKGKLLIRSAGVMICLLLMMGHVQTGAEIYMLDVGQGDGVVVMNDNRSVYIFDCGSSSKKNVGEKILIPFLKAQGINEVQGIFISHPDEDHINGIYNLIDEAVDENISVKYIYVYEEALVNGNYEQLKEYIKDASDNITLMGIEGGYSLTDGDMKISCLYPLGSYDEESNNNSLIFDIKYEGINVIDMGDLEIEGEEQLLKSVLDKNLESCNIIKIGHHGSSTSSSEELLDALKPQVALVSAGLNNKYGHPHTETMNKLKEKNISTFVTSGTGEIKIKCKKGHFYVSQYMK